MIFVVLRVSLITFQIIVARRKSFLIKGPFCLDSMDVTLFEQWCHKYDVEMVILFGSQAKGIDQLVYVGAQTIVKSFRQYVESIRNYLQKQT